MILLVVSIGCGPDPHTPRAPRWSPGAHPVWPFPYADRDHDSWPDDEDCAPDDPLVHPEAIELCNGIDDDCDGQGESDRDNDGFPWCAECDDDDASRFPGAPDPSGDGIDSDCDSTDGQGTPLPAPALTGGDVYWYGYALAAGDLDDDGCDELLVGQPGIAIFTTTPDSVALTEGCYPWSAVTVLTGEQDYRGETVDISGRSLVFLDGYYRGGRGRAQLFDADSFREGAAPVLDLLVDGIYSSHEIDDVALLGEGPDWLLWGQQGSPTGPILAGYGLLALPREGIFDLETEQPDMWVTSDSLYLGDGVGFGDIGDRDGDGRVDLGFGQQWYDDHSVYFFPEVTSGHLLDAPEIWRKGGGNIYNTRWVLDGDTDLDGDGLDDALVADVGDDVGAVPNAGRVYLVPWMGPGEHLLANAPARIDGELELDLTGIATTSGDLDADGQVDLVIGAPGCFTCFTSTVAYPYPGKAMVFLGPLDGVLDRDDAAVIFVGEQLSDHAGHALAIGDFDGSGRDDLAIGAPLASRDTFDEMGAVYVLTDPL